MNEIQPQATLKTKFVSCVAGGPNHSHLAGRKFFFCLFSFFLVRKLLKKNWGESKIKKKKKVPVRTNILTRPLDRKETFFKGGLME